MIVWLMMLLDRLDSRSDVPSLLYLLILLRLDNNETFLLAMADTDSKVGKSQSRIVRIRK